MGESTAIRFGHFDPRRNLPVATGRKRGETRFVCSFARTLSATLFPCGAGGRNFACNGYGIADFVWLVPPTRIPTRARTTPVPVARTPSPVVPGVLYAFEAKLSDWRRALQQAYRYSYFSDKAIVVLPRSRAGRVLDFLSLFRAIGIGLWLYDATTEQVRKVHTPRRCTAKNPRARATVIGAIVSRAKLC